ncbi:DUF6397 family protein [Streptomyces ziwulingensis]|uniref:DUF6397 family protein n=1 Tax=Streptomyces ziwulingensis TaxID=1045501 RepID=A0ABP9AX93_9ACTN
MSGNILTHSTAPTTAADRAAATTGDSLVALGRAARELGLRRGEFDIAMGLGRIRTVPDDRGGGRSVPQAEIDRIRAREGFGTALRDSVRTVGTTQGAALMEIPKARFTRLARLGLLVPVRFYLNRYRAVVWLYLADELERFAADDRHTALLTGRMSEELLDRLRAGQDRRPRNWRGRHLGFLLRQADGPWARAAAVASLLGPAEVAAVVADPGERDLLDRFRPAPAAHGAPGSPAADAAEEIMTAADPDEIDWLRADLTRAVSDARDHQPAPDRTTDPPAAHRPAPPPPPRTVPSWAPAPAVPSPVAPSPVAQSPAVGRARGLLAPRPATEAHTAHTPCRAPARRPERPPARPRGLLARLRRGNR